jgi:hypothetical protein
MAERKKKRPRDPVALAKLIGDIATGQTSDTEPDARNSAAVELGRLGGQKGGPARAKKLSQQALSDIGKKGARSRWRKAGST